MLARMHRAGEDFALRQPNLRGLSWWTETVPVVLPFVSAGQRALLESELLFQQQLAASPAFASLPQGVIHADLFRDNVMFESASGPGPPATGSPASSTSTSPASTRLLFDLAVCLNDWCIDLDSGRLIEERAQAFVAAYDAQRALSATEIRLLPALMRAGALRFWISRLWDLHLPRDAHLLTAHDPTHFERVLRQRVEFPWHYTRP